MDRDAKIESNRGRAREHAAHCREVIADFAGVAAEFILSYPGES